MNVSVGDVVMHQKREKGKNKSVYSCLISMHFIFDCASFLSATFYCNCYNTVEEIGISSSAVLVHEMSWSVSICRGGVLRYCCCHSHFSFQVLAKTGIVLVEVMFFLSAWIDNFSGGNREAALEKVFGNVFLSGWLSNLASLSPSSNPSKPIVLARNPKVNKLQVSRYQSFSYVLL